MFSCSAIIFVGLVESHQTSKSEPSNFRVMNNPIKPQVAIPSSFNIEVRPISPLRLWRSLTETFKDTFVISVRYFRDFNSAYVHF